MVLAPHKMNSRDASPQLAEAPLPCKAADPRSLSLFAAVATVVALLVAAGLFARSPAWAQTCSADSQCPGAGLSRSTCAGNTLVTTREVCAGTCRSVEVARTPCAGACVGDRCIATTPAPRVEPPLEKLKPQDKRTRQPAP